MFHILAYTAAPTAAATLGDAVAATDPSFSIRNGHFILTEDYNLLAAHVTGALVTAVEFKVPSINAVAPWNIYPPMLAVTEQANPNVDDYRAYRPPLPTNEELQVQITASGAEQENVFLWLGTPGWTSDLGGLTGSSPSIGGMGRRLTLLVTAAVAKVANAWSADAPLTFEQSLRAGVYAVIGVHSFLAGVLAMRMNFFINKPYGRNRKLFPGDLVSQTYGQTPNKAGRNWLGIWGFFHNFEPPAVAVWGNAAGAATLTMYMDCVYLGGSQNDLNSMIGGLAG